MTTRLWRSLYVEFYKSRRTLLILLTFIIPLVLAFLELMMGLQYGQRMYRPGGDAWATLIQHVQIMWTLLLSPLFITLEMGLLAAMEHNNKTWKLIYVLPLPGWMVYAAKQITGIVFYGTSSIFLTLFSVCVGLAIRVINPELGFDAAIPWGLIIQNLIYPFLASWLIISIHNWVSLRWSSFVLAMGVGISATIAGVLVFSEKWANFYPWTTPGTVVFNLIDGKNPLNSILFGVLGGVIVAIMGAWDVSRRDVLCAE